MKILNTQTWFVCLNWSRGAATLLVPPLATALFLRREENRSTRRKTSRSKDENQQQTQPTNESILSNPHMSQSPPKSSKEIFTSPQINLRVMWPPVPVPRGSAERISWKYCLLFSITDHLNRRDFAPKQRLGLQLRSIKHHRNRWMNTFGQVQRLSAYFGNKIWEIF